MAKYEFGLRSYLTSYGYGKKNNFHQNDDHKLPDKNIWHGQLKKCSSYFLDTKISRRNSRIRWFCRLEVVHVIGWSVQGPDELLVWEACAEWWAREGPAGDHLVAHHLEAVEDGDGVGRELHPPVLLVPHVRAGAALLSQDPELSKGQPVHQ